MSIISDLIAKQIDVENAAITATQDNNDISELLKSIVSRPDKIQ